MFAVPDKLYNLWKNFKHVSIGCSIDGKDKMANYLRPPSTWDRLEKNLNKLDSSDNQNITAAISTTVSVYNVLHFLDFTDWLLSKEYKIIGNIPVFHMLDGPHRYSVQVLPKDVKKKITKTYENYYNRVKSKFGITISREIESTYSGIINYMNLEDKSNLLPKLADSTYRLDAIRNQQLADVIPWLDEILKNFV